MVIKKKVKKAIKSAIPIDSGPAQPITPKEKKIYTESTFQAAVDKAYRDGQKSPPQMAMQERSPKEQQELAKVQLNANQILEQFDIRIVEIQEKLNKLNTARNFIKQNPTAYYLCTMLHSIY